MTYLIVNGTLLVIIWNGYLSIQGGWLSQGALIALINYLLQILVELIKLAMLINSLNQSYISAKRINEVFAEKPEDILAEIAQKETSSNQSLRVEHLSFTYQMLLYHPCEIFLLLCNKDKFLESSVGLVLVSQPWSRSYLAFMQQIREAFPFIEMDVVLAIFLNGGPGWLMSLKKLNSLREAFVLT